MGMRQKEAILKAAKLKGGKLKAAKLKATKLKAMKSNFDNHRAKKDRIEYCWVDTCCINRASHSELSEAITSMFCWYQEAEKCCAYLSDVSLEAEDQQAPSQQTWNLSLHSS